METKLKNPFVVNGHAVTKELLIRYVTYLPKPVPVRHHFSTLPPQINPILILKKLVFLEHYTNQTPNCVLIPLGPHFWKWTFYLVASCLREDIMRVNKDGKKRGRRRSNNIHSQHALSTRQLGIPFSGVFVPSGP